MAARALPVPEATNQSALLNSHRHPAGSIPFDVSAAKNLVTTRKTAHHLSEINDHSSTVQHADFVKEAILKLEDSGSTVEMNQEDIHISSPLGVVPKKNNKFRLILDVRYLNKHLASFKFEDLRIASELLNQGDWFFTFDLLNGYHHIDIGGEHRKYLGFSYQLEGRVRYFVFASLPFGLSTAPYVFKKKIMRPLVNYWRGKAKKMLMYMDDGIGAAASKNATRELASEVKNDLHQSGLLVNSEKSDFQPRQFGEFLGYTLDLESGKFRVPRHKIDDLQSLLIGTLSASDFVTASLP